MVFIDTELFYIMKSEHRVAEIIQKLVDKKNLKTNLIENIQISYSEDLDYYLIFVSVKRDNLLKEYIKLYNEAENDFWKEKFEKKINYYFDEISASHYDLRNFLDVNGMYNLYVTIEKLFEWSDVPEGYMLFKIKILV